MIRGRRRTAAAALASALLLLCGCGPVVDPAPLAPEVLASVEDSTREHVTAVAEQLGTEISVRRQEWLQCMGSSDDRNEYVYGIRVELAGEETFEAVADRLHAHFQARGWAWRDTDASLSMVRLTHGDYIVAASIFVDDGYASITGGAGCIGSLEDVPEQDQSRT